MDPSHLEATDGCVALYVDHLGPYPELLGRARVWTRERDATRYEGPLPVLAHPECGPWSVARALSSGEGRELAPRAVEQVRRWGGVLEHPAHSALWGWMGLPRPGDPPDELGGFSLAVDQARWGHPAAKPTWLYVVRAWVPPIPPAVDLRGLPGVFDLGAGDKRRTPPAFARWLIALASSARVAPAAGSTADPSPSAGGEVSRDARSKPSRASRCEPCRAPGGEPSPTTWSDASRAPERHPSRSPAHDP